MWLGERITENGIGNGISLLIFAGIISNIARSVYTNVYSLFAASTQSNIGGMIASIVVFVILIVGIVHTGIAYVLYFGSMRDLKAQSIAVLSYIDPVFALFLSALVLQEKLSIFGIIGAVLVIGSALVSELTGEKK